ncbi:hypothetical protein DY000_02010287 [Brassica cretica]|uniref:REJ domain-containing protein n=1 Tax=Brassica cretica TaxID=69181 RepID=A0ABQ7CEA5_BRACR|nr:hypothetical protein DY000_02010287 [Brassica cretica]
MLDSSLPALWPASSPHDSPRSRASSSPSQFVVSVSGLNRELHLLLRLRLGSWWWFTSCSSQQNRTHPLQLRLSSLSWLSFRSRSSTAPPIDLSSKSPTPSYSLSSPSSESAVVTAGIVGIEVKKNDNGDL